MVIEQVIEAIHEHERNGAWRSSLAILCGANAVKLIGEELPSLARCLTVNHEIPPYPMLEDHIGREVICQAWRGAVLNVPIFFDPDCPIDYWRVQRFPAIEHPPEFGKDSRWRWNAQKQNWIRNEKTNDDGTRCPLCGNEIAPRMVDGWQIASCNSCGKYASSAGRVKNASIQLVNDAFRDARDIIKRSGEAWSDAVLPDDAWSKQTSKEREEVKQVRAERRQAAQFDGLIDRLSKRGHESEFNPVAVRMGYPAKSLMLTAEQESQARAEWSRRLRELQAEARRKEREQVVVDIDWD